MDPIAEALSDFGVSETALREASPQAMHHFTQADQINALVLVSETNADPGFMTLAADGVVQLAAHQPGNRLQ